MTKKTLIVGFAGNVLINHFVQTAAKRLKTCVHNQTSIIFLWCGQRVYSNFFQHLHSWQYLAFGDEAVPMG